MGGDVFGNLDAWGRVLEKIDELERLGELDAHAAGLARILRYRDNWRLRERALEAMARMRACSPELVSEAVRILRDPSLYHQVRVLAAEALASAAGTLRSRGDPPPDAGGWEIEHAVREVLGSCEVPVLHQAVRRILSVAGEERAGGRA